MISVCFMVVLIWLRAASRMMKWCITSFSQTGSNFGKKKRRRGKVKKRKYYRRPMMFLNVSLVANRTLPTLQAEMVFVKLSRAA